MLKNLSSLSRPSTLSLLGAILLISMLASAQVSHVIYRFQGGDDGAIPNSNLVPDGTGGFYGLTRSGGSANCDGYGCGTFYHLTLSKSGKGYTKTILYRFTGTPDVTTPSSGLINDNAGNFYGVSSTGGVDNWGAVFELSPPAQQGGAWTEAVLYSFTDGLDGAYPEGGLVFGRDGALYGTGFYGGSNNNQFCFFGCGVVFRLAPPSHSGSAWTESAIYNFTDLLGAFPTDMTLAVDRAGNLYGTTSYLGVTQLGSVFRLSPPAVQGGPWKFNTLYSFLDNSDQFFPLSGVVLDEAGNLYGTANGSETALGVVFELVRPASGHDWTFNLLYTFGGSPLDGAHPQTRPLLDGKGGLYGTTFSGGASSLAFCVEVTGCGVAFHLTPNGDGTWTETILHSFGASQADGQHPYGALVNHGNLIYGITNQGGGPLNNGTIFAIQP